MPHPNSTTPHDVTQVLYEGDDDLFTGSLDAVAARIEELRVEAQQLGCRDVRVVVDHDVWSEYGSAYLETRIVVSGTRPETQREIDQRRARYARQHG